MARAEFTLNLNGLEELQRRLDSPLLVKALNQAAGDKGTAALVAQAIADNFAKEGPGWAPLKGATIRTSVAKSILKQLTRSAGLVAARQMKATKKDKNGVERIDPKKLEGRRRWFYHYMDKEIEAMERRTRAGREGGENRALGSRQILRRTSLLYQTVTTPNPNAAFSTSEGGKARVGQNIMRVEGTNLIYGTSLVYAATHNYGDPERHIPKREFLVIREEWRLRLVAYASKLLQQTVANALKGNV